MIGRCVGNKVFNEAEAGLFARLSALLLKSLANTFHNCLALPYRASGAVSRPRARVPFLLASDELEAAEIAIRKVAGTGHCIQTAAAAEDGATATLLPHLDLGGQGQETARRDICLVCRDICLVCRDM